jgi:uncharacterized membrane protein
MDVKRIGHAGLVGWREKVGDKAARAVAERTRLHADTLRAIFGAVFLALAVKTTAEMAVRLTRAARGQKVA